MAFRLDIGELRPAKRLTDGRLVAEGRLTRTGVFLYHDGEGNEFREYRPPEEVFDADSMTTFSMVPITDDHPPKSLDASNARKFAVGATGERIRRDGNWVLGSVMVFDADVITKMDGGKCQLSCGYQADVEIVAGVTPDGDRYDAIQRNIRGNHVAIVDVGRAGPETRVRMDASVMIGDAPKTVTVTDSGDDMPDKTLDEMQKALASKTEEAAKEKVRADTAEKLMDEAGEKIAGHDKIVADLKTDHDKAIAKIEGEREAFKTQLAKAEKAREDAVVAEPARIRSRVELETAGERVLNAGVDEDKRVTFDGMKDREIRVAIIKKIDDTEIDAEKADEYVDAWYDSAIKRSAKADDSLSAARRTIDGGGVPEVAVDAESKARAKMEKHLDEIATA